MNARWWVLGVGLAGAASIACLLALRPRFGRPKVTLPGGATMILERVEVGNVHRLVLGYPALKKLQKFLPSFVYSRLPQSAEETIHYPRVNLGFWFSCTGLGALYSPFQAPQIIDEHGCVFRVREWTPRTLRGQQFSHLDDGRGRKIEQRPYSRGRDGLHIHCLQWPDDLPEANLNIVVEKGDDLAPENIATTKTVEFVVKPPKRLSQAREPTP